MEYNPCLASGPFDPKDSWVGGIVNESQTHAHTAILTADHVPEEPVYEFQVQEYKS